MKIGTQKIGNVQVTASEWKRDNQHRVYFKAGHQGQACWDMNRGEWVKVHGEFGARFKGYIRSAFDF